MERVMGGFEAVGRARAEWLGSKPSSGGLVMEKGGRLVGSEAAGRIRIAITVFS